MGFFFYTHLRTMFNKATARPVRAAAGRRPSRPQRQVIRTINLRKEATWWELLEDQQFEDAHAE